VSTVARPTRETDYFLGRLVIFDAKID